MSEEREQTRDNVDLADHIGVLRFNRWKQGLKNSRKDHKILQYGSSGESVMEVLNDPIHPNNLIFSLMFLLDEVPVWQGSFTRYFIDQNSGVFEGSILDFLNMFSSNELISEKFFGLPTDYYFIKPLNIGSSDSAVEMKRFCHKICTLCKDTSCRLYTHSAQWLSFQRLIDDIMFRRPGLYVDDYGKIIKYENMVDRLEHVLSMVTTITHDCNIIYHVLDYIFNIRRDSNVFPIHQSVGTTRSEFESKHHTIQSR